MGSFQHFFMFIFMIGSAKVCFVLELIIHTDSKTVICDLLYCIYESFSFRPFFFFSFISPEFNMIVMCHNVILVLI